MQSRRRKQVTVGLWLLLALVCVLGYTVKADVARPAMEDFDWFTETIITTGIPENDGWIDGYDETVGDWKCIMISDVESYPRDGVVVLCNLTIEGTYAAGDVVFDWYQRIFLPDWNTVSEEYLQDSLFTGSATGRGLYFIGGGNLLLTDFYRLGGYEYGIGSFTYPSGEVAKVGLVRPTETGQELYPSMEVIQANPFVEGTQSDGGVQIIQDVQSVFDTWIDQETQINNNTQINQETQVNNNAQINQETQINNNTQINQGIQINNSSQINQNSQVNHYIQINSNETSVVNTTVNMTFVQNLTVFCVEQLQEVWQWMGELVFANTQLWELFPKKGMYLADPVDLYTRYDAFSMAVREFSLENTTVPYALLVEQQDYFEQLPVGLTDAVKTKHGWFYPVTTGSRYILEVYDSFGEAALQEQEATYAVTALLAPPEPTFSVTGNVLNVQFPQASFAILNDLMDGYRLTIVSSDGKTSEMLYRKSVAGTERQFELGEVAYTFSSQLTFQVSLCEFIEDENGLRYFGPESGETGEMPGAVAGVNDEPSEEEVILDERLIEENAISGDITVSMLWNTTDDMDLHMDTPEGEIYYSNKHTEHGELDVDMQISSPFVDNPIENIYMNDPPSGDYRIWIRNYTDRTDGDTDVMVRVTIHGQQRIFNVRVDREAEVFSFRIP